MDVPIFSFFNNQSTFFELVSCFHLVGGLHYRPCPSRVGSLALYISPEFDETIQNLDFLLRLLKTGYFIPRNPDDPVYRICSNPVLGNRVIQFPILSSAINFGHEHRCHEVSGLMPAFSSPGPWRLQVVGREHHSSTVREGFCNLETILSSSLC